MDLSPLNILLYLSVCLSWDPILYSYKIRKDLREILFCTVTAVGLFRSALSLLWCSTEVVSPSAMPFLVPAEVTFPWFPLLAWNAL